MRNKICGKNPLCKDTVDFFTEYSLSCFIICVFRNPRIHPVWSSKRLSLLMWLLPEITSRHFFNCSKPWGSKNSPRAKTRLVFCVRWQKMYESQSRFFRFSILLLLRRGINEIIGFSILSKLNKRLACLCFSYTRQVSLPSPSLASFEGLGPIFFTFNFLWVNKFSGREIVTMLQFSTEY